MESRAFKALIGEIAGAHGFKSAHGAWYQELPIALFTLNLQKSNFGNYFDLNLKLFLRRTIPRGPGEMKRLLKGLTGDIFRSQPPECRRAFDLDEPLGVEERREIIDQMFKDLVDRIARASVAADGILDLRDQGILFLLPGIEARLKAG